MMSTQTCFILNCTLKPSPAESSSDLLGSQLLSAFEEHGVSGQMARVVDQDVRFGVSTDEGDGDEWPQLRERSEEHTSELQSLMRISYAVFCLKKKNIK